MPENPPAPQEREANQLPTLREWIEGFLPFQLPHIPLPQTAKNLDKAAGQLVLGVGDNLSARLRSSTNSIEALGTARTTYITRGQAMIEQGSMALDERALRYILENAKLEQTNRERVLELGAEEVSRNPPQEDATQEIESEWLRAFSRYASDKSSDDIRALWAKILAGEIKAPGSVSLRSLALIATYSKADAEAAHGVLDYTINDAFILTNGYRKVGDDGESLKFSLGGEVKGAPYSMCLRGIELGLLTPQSSRRWPNEGKDIFFATHLRGFLFKFGSLDALLLNTVDLTEAGRELLSLSSDLREPDTYFEAFKTLLAGQGSASSVQVGDVSRKADGSITFGNFQDASRG